MRPSFSPTHVTVDGDSGRPRFDDDQGTGGDDLLARFAAHLSPSPARKDHHLPQQLQDVNSRAFIVQGALQAALCGGIIAVVLCPCMIGFSTIIYSHPAFAPVMPKLTKLVFLSSVVHQLVISSLSPLPFAIGQVQDAGLIFLSTMATSIMTELGDAVPLDERVATVVVHLSISTMLIGLGLVLTGKARLASLVQYLPTPVIGGYLAYIGFFMIKGGVSLMTGLTMMGLISWSQVFSTQRYLVLTLPGVTCGVLLSVATTRYRHFGVFPGCLVMIPLVFFVALALTHTSLDEARDSGFLAEEGPMISLASVYELFAFEKVHWRVMFPAQLPTLLSMFVMLAFASSLDIASICMGTDTDTTANMDYNEQLQTVGASNLLSGLAGGYTGSYIFSQTIFSYRFHPTAHEAVHPGLSRLIGLSLMLCELGIALTPFALTTVVPKFLFGSVMVFIGIELLRTWLIGVYHKLLVPEYATVLGTFGFLNAFGVQMGLALGVAMAALCFLVEYATSQVVRIVDKSSNVVRNAEQHELLYSHQVHDHRATASPPTATLKQRAIVTVELQGHIFFGSATRIQSCVKRAVYVWQSNNNEGKSSKTSACSATGSSGESLPLLASATLACRYDEEAHRRLVNLDGDTDTRDYSHIQQPTRFVVFDFSRVSGLDATAARSCFLALKLLFSHHRVTAVYCGMSAAVEFLLRANDVLPSLHDLEQVLHNKSCHVTSDLDLALDWCEQQLILAAARKRSFESGLQLCGSPFESRTLSLRQIFLAYLTNERRRVVTSQSNAMMMDELESYFHISEWSEDDRIFETDEPADAWYVLLRGQVTLCTRSQSASADDESPLASPRDRPRIMSLSTVVSSITSSTRSNSLSHYQQQQQHGRSELVSRVRAGCIFGDLDYVLNQLHVLEATASASDTVVAAISREKMNEMRDTRLDLAFLMQEVLLRASCMTMAEKLHSIVV